MPNISLNPTGVRKDRHIKEHHQAWPAMTEPFDGWREMDAYEFGEDVPVTLRISEHTPELTGELTFTESDIDAMLDQVG